MIHLCVRTQYSAKRYADATQYSAKRYADAYTIIVLLVLLLQQLLLQLLLLRVVTSVPAAAAAKKNVSSFVLLVLMDLIRTWPPVSSADHRDGRSCTLRGTGGACTDRFSRS